MRLAHESENIVFGANCDAIESPELLINISAELVLGNRSVEN